MIKISNHIQRILVKISPSLKDQDLKARNPEYLNSNEFEVDLPAEFPAGKQHTIGFTCIGCFQNIEFNARTASSYSFNKSLYLRNFKDQNTFESFGHLFKLHQHTITDDYGKIITSNFTFTGKYKPVAEVGAFKCPSCKAQYLIAYAYLEGENERTPEPDIMYIDQILQVEMSELVWQNLGL